VVVVAVDADGSVAGVVEASVAGVLVVADASGVVAGWAVGSVGAGAVVVVAEAVGAVCCAMAGNATVRAAPAIAVLKILIFML
jgi:hypothetical protein